MNKEVKLKKFEVFATQLVDCVIEIQAETRDDAMEEATNISWEEWKRESNSLDIYDALEIKNK